jgi:hypothetical protein
MGDSKELSVVLVVVVASVVMGEVGSSTAYPAPTSQPLSRPPSRKVSVAVICIVKVFNPETKSLAVVENAVR